MFKFYLLNLIMAALLLVFVPDILYGDEKQPIENELNKIWGIDKSIEVVKEKVFPNANMHEIVLSSGIVPNDSYYLYFPVIFRYSYFLTETLGLELNGKYFINTNSDLKNFLDEQEFFRTKGVPEKLTWTGGADLAFTPLKGKINLMGTKLFHFDISFYLGGGGIGVTVTEGDKTKNKFTGYGEWGLGMRMHLNKFMALRLDYRNMIYPATEGLSFPADITFGISAVIR